MTATHVAAERALGLRWEEIYDPYTIDIVERLPIERTWRCLELGAGLGSMSRWLSRRADRGTVIAVDLDTSGIDTTGTSSLTVREQDLMTAEFDAESFDLVLARATLEQVPQRDEALRRAARWLAPGGWLLVQDFYYLPGEHAPTPEAQAVLDAYLRGWRMQGVDMTWARTLPSALARLGLAPVEVQVTPLGPGQHRLNTELIRERMLLQGGNLVSRGWVSRADLDAFVAGLDDPANRDVSTLLFSVWGRRPRT